MASSDAAAWHEEVEALGKSHSLLLRKYAIAVDTDPRFRHVDLIREGWHSDDEGRSYQDGKIIWATYIPLLKKMGRQAVQAAVLAQQYHEERINDTTRLTYGDIHMITEHDPTIAALFASRGWRWNVCSADGHWGSPESPVGVWRMAAAALPWRRRSP